MNGRSLTAIHTERRRRNFGHMMAILAAACVPVFIAAWLPDSSHVAVGDDRVDLRPLPQDIRWLCEQTGDSNCTAADLPAAYGLNRREYSGVACVLERKASHGSAYDPERRVTLRTYSECPETGGQRCRGQLRDLC